jgi:hypothetical protein
MTSWAIYRKTEDVEVYIGVITAKDEQDALAKATLLLPEEDRRTLLAKPWGDEKEPAGTAGSS